MSRQEGNGETKWCEHCGGVNSNRVALDVAEEEVVGPEGAEMSIGTPVQPANKPGNMGPTTPSGQATNLPHAFNTETLMDLANDAWNMDTCASSQVV
ncbi:hypothetical protein Tco_1383486 [Tanacetum coccineum]